MVRLQNYFLLWVPIGFVMMGSVSCSEPVPYDPCTELTCGGHGVCQFEHGSPRCACFEGYHPRGTTCVADNTDGDADLDADSVVCEVQEEICNGEDDDCDGVNDEDFDCVQGEVSTCITSCGTEGSRRCEESCQWSTYCEPPEELCNGEDDNCDGDLPRSEIDLDEDGILPCDGDCNDHDETVGRCDCLAVGGGGLQLRVYKLDGTGGLTLVWSSDEAGMTRSLTWVDWDGDGDQDLAAGNEGDSNRIYRRTETGFELAWESEQLDATYSMRWADWDEDGDMDPVIGNYSQPNRLFRNNDGVLEEVWTFGDGLLTLDVLWGDVNGDGELDLIEVNHRSIRVYEANAGEFFEIWATSEHTDVTALDIGHFESDSYPRLVVGTQTGLHIYHRDGEAYSLTDTHADIAWISSLVSGDFDFDGDDDLAIATSHEVPDRLLENVDGHYVHIWEAPIAEDSFAAAWIDFDRNGVLDISFDDTIYRSASDDYEFAWSPEEWNNTRSIAWGECGEAIGE